MHTAAARQVIAIALIGGLVALSSACSRVQAKTPGPAPVPLAVPEPPARLHIPVSADPPPATSAEKPPASNPAKPRPTPTPTATPTPTPTPTSTAPPPDPTPPPVVQTSGQAENEARAKALLTEAERNLAKVQWKTLGREARAQYDSAQQFVRMTKLALAQRNFPFAFSCADKAATLAALLVKG